ncbi:CNNM domain-containing protein [Luteococcus sp. H138]|uniref:CNNM domain-containing protein n=1 Tax=unclassified Luteococcus TaxID=2639923 RepID=UPI00313A867B
MSGLVVILATIALIVASAFFVVVEFALLGARRHRLEAEASESRSARAALLGMNELTMMLAGAQLGITACTFALGAVTKPALDAALGPALVMLGAPRWVSGTVSFVLSMLIVTFLHLVVGEMAPKSWAIANPERAAKLVAPAARAFVWPLRPLLSGINHLANRLVLASGVTPVDRSAVGGQDAETIRQLVEQSAARGSLDRQVTDQISEVLDLQELTVADLHPRPIGDLTLPAEATMEQVQQLASKAGAVRVFLAGRGTPRVVHVRDTLGRPAQEAAAAVARTALVLQAGLPVNQALQQMRSSSEQLAVVPATAEEGDGDPGRIGLSDILQRLMPHAPEPAAES